MKYNTLLVSFLASFTLFGLLAVPSFSADRPNIVWIFAEDMNDWMGCYGDDTVPTPNIDALASGGVQFHRAYMPAGVCSATRSAIALGAMQTSLGVHNHRSSRQRYPGEEIRLPKENKTVYQTLRAGGYHVINYGPKSDFNFLWASQNEKELNRPKGTSAIPAESDEDLLYDVNVLAWAPSGNLLPQLLKECPDDKPVFLQLQLKGGKNSGKFEGFPAGKTSPEDVEVMPYYADLPSVRSEIAHHYDCIRQTDEELGQIVKTLKEHGFDKNTVVFFFTDHGMKLPRHKQWLYEGSIRVPLVIAGPGIPAGTTRDDLVSGIDITGTTLALAGIPQPKHMEAKDFFASDFQRDFVISARDRCDYTIERVRAVTGQRLKYLRNFKTDRPFMQPQYRDGQAFMKDLKAYYQAGKMNDIESFIMSETRVPEELYDLKNDPDEIHNLATDPAYQEQLEKYRGILDQWIEQTGDQGQYDESVASLKGVLKQWSKQAVNPEYDKAR
ncbi:Arylsulfatase [Bremerella volcania]|uniref:Arylsulfatase n=1 Tax=Bremerella volcania TaxID=2527984 RepID=A0A518CFY5_9BACT|nr:sulfatase [Bremerella volcania]QDU78143.1 Arylsulfatase [Bremerella volcania]